MAALTHKPAYRERAIALGDRIPGFGHTIYKNGDPRADSLLAALAEAGADPRLAVAVPARITEATGLHPNIDFALAVIMRLFGQPIESIFLPDADPAEPR